MEKWHKNRNAVLAAFLTKHKDLVSERIIHGKFNAVCSSETLLGNRLPLVCMHAVH